MGTVTSLSQRMLMRQETEELVDQGLRKQHRADGDFTLKMSLLLIRFLAYGYWEDQGSPSGNKSQVRKQKPNKSCHSRDSNPTPEEPTLPPFLSQAPHHILKAPSWTEEANTAMKKPQELQALGGCWP